MNILFLSLLDVDVNDKQSIYGSVLYELKKAGHTLFVVSNSERRNNKATKLEKKDGVSYLRIRTGNIQKTNIIEKGISTIMLESQFKRAIKKHTKGQKFDLILYSTPPITFCNVISYFKKRDNAKTFLMLKDIFPQNAVDIGLFKKNGLLYRYFRKKEIELYRISDRIGCMSNKNIEYVKTHNDIDERKLELFPNSIIPSKSNIRNLKRNIALRKKYNIPNDATVFVYGGNIGKPQGVDFIIKCLYRAASIKDSFFIVCGDGTDYQRLEKACGNKFENVLLLNGLPKKEYSELLNVADVGLIFLDYRFTIPNFPSRLLSYMEKGIPILCCTDENTDIGEVVKSNNFGWAIYSLDDRKFSSITKKIISERAYIYKKGQMAYHYLKDNYNSINNAKIILRLINEGVDGC